MSNRAIEKIKNLIKTAVSEIQNDNKSSQKMEETIKNLIESHNKLVERITLQEESIVYMTSTVEELMHMFDEDEEEQYLHGTINNEEGEEVKNHSAVMESAGQQNAPDEIMRHGKRYLH